jgi:DNA primase catalytic core
MKTIREFREEVKRRADLLTVVEQTCIVDHRSARLIKVLCPFHAEDTPSCVIYPDQQRFHCYGCNERGDVIDWVMKRDNLDHRGALESLARQFGVEIPEYQVEDPQQRDIRLEAEKLLTFAANHYHEYLFSAPDAEPHREYLRGRGFDEDVWKRWQVGAAGSKNELCEALTRQNLNIDLAVEIGLLNRNQHRLYEHLRGRIIIPFIHAGQVRFVTGRAIHPDVKPKYLHLRNSEYAWKTLYNPQSAAKDLLVLEGPMDVWAVDLLADDSVSAVALMGLAADVHELERAMKHRRRVYIGLDSDDAGSQNAIIDGIAQRAGPSRARVVRWPGGDDPAAWLKEGVTGEAFMALLENSRPWTGVLVDRIQSTPEDERPEAVRAAVEVAAGLLPEYGDPMVKAVKVSIKGFMQTKTIDEMVKTARKAFSSNGHSENGNGHHAEMETPEELPYYYLIEGEMWRGHGESARRITRGGHAIYTEMVTVDDGEETELQLTLEVRQKEEVQTARILAKSSHEPTKVIEPIRGLLGPLFSVAPKEGPHFVAALDAMSQKLARRVEIARTGWVDTSEGLAFVTPGGVVGKLPDGMSVALPKNLSQIDNYRVADDGDEAFRKGLEGLLTGFLNAFDHHITYPALAFALMPVAAHWLPHQRFAMHLNGETGSLKTETARVMMSLYGDFVDKPPLISWRSTINAIEYVGFWLPDVIGLVDDYKPSLTSPKAFAELIQRYADGNSRDRLSRDIQMRQQRSMRWWLLSTGEDLPTGEASVLARMINIRFPRRPTGVAFNHNLGMAQRLAKYFPTVTARWAAWLTDPEHHGTFEAQITLYHQQIADYLQKEAPEVPNINRISRNLGVLWTVWDAWTDFLLENGAAELIAKGYTEFRGIVGRLALSIARQVVEEKPTRIYLDAVQEGLDSGRFRLLPRYGEDKEMLYGPGFIGWHDIEGVYLTGDVFHDVAKWRREAGQEIGFSVNELHRLFKEEGLLAKVGKSTVTTNINVRGRGSPRVLHLRPGILSTPAVAQGTGDDE